MEFGMTKVLYNFSEEEFYMDYKEAFGHVVEQLNKFHNVED